MKRNHLIFLGCALAFLFISSVHTSAGMPDKQEEAGKELKNQTHCPVMGGKIDSTVYTDIQGQRVYHCCPMCSDKLKADPDKYFKKAAEEGILFENIQTACPVSGMELEEKSSFIDYEGRRIYFCCDGCAGPFNEEPQEYLSKLDAPVEKMEDHKDHMKGHEDDKKDHEGHDH